MAEVGVLVTDEEVSDFVHGWSAVGSFKNSEQILIQGVEAEVERECGRTFTSTTYTDEEYSIPEVIVRDSLVIRQATEFRLKQYPVTTFTALKKVTERSTVTGLATATETLAREGYHVELPTGIVRIIKPDKLDPFNIWPGTGFPQGTMILLATYTAGSIPKDLKLLVLQIIARLFIQQKNMLWGRTSQGIDGLNNTYPDIAFTESEMRKLHRFKKWHFA